ncbi:MAG: N-acetylglucosamine kinase [Blastocatellia bacterium]|nr:N-acetylglucosamine kinase [Blastocatellia bacterium]
MKAVISEEVFSESQTSSGREDLTNYYLGVDGGGTNCRAVIVDEAGGVCGEGRAEAANFHRVGLEIAIAHIESAVVEACQRAGIEPRQITAACLGLAGVSHPKDHNRMLAALKAALPISDLTLETDARVALAGATGNQPGIVIIAGTGSIACGINSRGRFARAGGWGPTMGDEGSGAYIGRRALEAILMAYDYRGEPTTMLEPVLRYFGVSSPPELPSVIYDSPAEAQSRIAQLSRIVVKAAQEGDKVARSILKNAAEELAKAAIAVIEQLKMEKDSFKVAYVGGVFESGELILTTLCEEIKKVAPNAEIAPPLNPPVIGAVRMALEKKS